MQRVSIYRVRVGSGFALSGSGRVRVFADFENRVRFYTVGFRVFVGFLICAKKWQIFEKIYNFEKKYHNFFLLLQMYDNSFVI